MKVKITQSTLNLLQWIFGDISLHLGTRKESIDEKHRSCVTFAVDFLEGSFFSFFFNSWDFALLIYVF